MSVETAVCFALFVLLVLVSLSVFIYKKIDHNIGFGLMFVACTLATSTFYFPETFVFIGGPQEYIVQKDSITHVFKSKNILLLKPDGKIRSYALVRDTFLWKPKSPVFPAMKVVLETKGSVTLSEEYYAARDSIRMIVPDSISADPLTHLGCRVSPIDRFYEVLSKGLQIQQTVRIRSITFRYDDNLNTRDCKKGSG